MKLILRILRGLLVALLALAVAVIVSIPVDRLLTRGRVAELTNVVIAPQTDTAAKAPPVRAYLATPATPAPDLGPLPAVIMIHEFWGLRPDIVEKADALAAEGYLVLAPDVFRGVSTGWVPSAIWNVLSTPDAQVRTDLQTAYRGLVMRPEVDSERIAVMGFCFGGGAALDYSLHAGESGGEAGAEPAATAVFYGDLVTDPGRLEQLPGPLLGVFGAEDRSISIERVDAFAAALEAAGVPHEIHVYAGVGHAFVGGLESIRGDGPAAQAWQRLLDFLADALKGGASPSLVRAPG